MTSNLKVTDEDRELAAWWCLRLAEGDLQQHERAAFSEWLDSNEQHPTLMERTAIAWQAIEDQASEPEMIVMRSDALESVRRANRNRWGRVSHSWHQFAAMAACLLLLIGGGLWWNAQPTTYSTGLGERRMIALADGSTVSLDADSRVDVRYSDDKRELWLRSGRAKFSVAKDPLRAFSVHADDRLIIATGTQFSVEKVADQVRVVLIEGQISVVDKRPRSGPAASPEGNPKSDVRIAPGQELVLAEARVPSHPQAVDLTRAVSWESGLLQFSDEPLSIVVERMNRYSSTQLRVGDPDAAKVQISGQFKGGDIEAFVEGITAVFPVEVEQQTGSEVVLGKRSR